MIQHLDLLSMSDEQFFDFANQEFVGDDGRSGVKLKSEQDVIKWFEPCLEDCEKIEDYDFARVKSEIQRLIYPGKFPFDGDEYIPSLELYQIKKEEEDAPFIEKNLPLLGEYCKVYPTLRRIVYENRGFDFLGDGESFGDDPLYVLSSSELRMSFDQYIDKIFVEQVRMTKVIMNLSSPD